MTVLHVDSGREMRGGQWQVLHLLHGLAAAGHSSSLLAPAASPLFRNARKEGLTVDALTAMAVYRAARRAQLTHVHDARSHSLAWILAQSPVVVSRRVAFPVHRSPVSRLKYRSAAHFLAISEAVEKQLTDAGVPAERISVVHDGVALHREPSFKKDGYVLALESTDRMKGRAEIEKAAAIAGTVVRWSSDLAADLSGARLFVYISKSEGLGSAALLAMSAGVPVIASRVGGLPEVVADGITGFLTENDPQQIAGTIQHALADDELCNRLAIAARATVETRFSVSRMIENTIAVYQRVLQCSQ